MEFALALIYFKAMIPCEEDQTLKLKYKIIMRKHVSQALRVLMMEQINDCIEVWHSRKRDSRLKMIKEVGEDGIDTLCFA